MHINGIWWDFRVEGWSQCEMIRYFLRLAFEFNLWSFEDNVNNSNLIFLLYLHTNLHKSLLVLIVLCIQLLSNKDLPDLFSSDRSLNKPEIYALIRDVAFWERRHNFLLIQLVLLLLYSTNSSHTCYVGSESCWFHCSPLIAEWFTPGLAGECN